MLPGVGSWSGGVVLSRCGSHAFGRTICGPIPDPLRVGDSSEPIPIFLQTLRQAGARTHSQNNVAASPGQDAGVSPGQVVSRERGPEKPSEDVSSSYPMEQALGPRQVY